MSKINTFARTLAAGLIASAILATSVMANDDIFSNEERQRAFIKEKIIEYFPEDYPTMLAIAYCETRDRPFIHWEPDGTLRPHKTKASTAGGAFQVLIGLHGPDIKARNLDMNNIDDYLTFVRYLYERGPSRFSDWKESKGCWSKQVRNFELRVADRS